MKKAVISGIIVIFVILGIGMSYMLFRGGIRTEKEQKSYEEQEKQMENLMKPGQEEEADDTSEEFSRKIEKKTGISVNPQNVVSARSTIRSGKYDITVTDWSVSKESPGYAIPEGVDLAEFPGAQLDKSGNITNEFSYVTANVMVKNITEESITDHIWGYFNLKTFHAGEYLGEPDYLGNIGKGTSREHGHDTYKESFSPEE